MRKTSWLWVNFAVTLHDQYIGVSYNNTHIFPWKWKDTYKFIYAYDKLYNEAYIFKHIYNHLRRKNAVGLIFIISFHYFIKNL